MSKSGVSLFTALATADKVVVDGLLVQRFSLQGGAGGSGILVLEDATEISFANQEVIVVGGYSAFQTEAEKPHSIDFIMGKDRAMCASDLAIAPRADPRVHAQATRPQCAGSAPGFSG